MKGLGGLVADRPTCIALLLAGGAHLALTAAGLPGWPCPVRAATGLPCPGCGLTRASALLLSGRVREAFATHAFAPLALVGILLVAVGVVLPGEARLTFGATLNRLDASGRVTKLILAALLLYWLARLSLDGSGSAQVNAAALIN